MSTNTPLKNQIQKLKTELEKDQEIELAILFGSCAKGNANFNSDIDIGIKLNKSLLENKKTSLIQLIAVTTGRAVDLVDLRKVGQPLLSQIIKYGMVIKGQEEMFTELAIRNIYANEDFLPYIKRSLQTRREKWIK